MRPDAERAAADVAAADQVAGAAEARREGFVGALLFGAALYAGVWLLRFAGALAEVLVGDA